MSARARPYPVGPASYATRVGPGSEAQKSTTSLVSPDSLRTRNSPVPLSMLAASTLRACTSRPAQLRTFAMVGTSRMDVVVDRRGVTLGVSHSPHAMRGVPTYIRHDDQIGRAHVLNSSHLGIS